MTPPATYSEWLTCLDRARSDEHDEALLARMEAGSLEWTSGVAERFVSEFYKLIEWRLMRAAELFQRDLRLVQRSPDDLVRAIMAIRRRMEVSLRLSRLKALPESVQSELDSRIREHAKKCQESMEQSARHDRSGRLLSIVRNNPVTALETVGAPARSDTARSAGSAALKPEPPSGVGRRRVLL